MVFLIEDATNIRGMHEYYMITRRKHGVTGDIVIVKQRNLAKIHECEIKRHQRRRLGELGEDVYQQSPFGKKDKTIEIFKKQYGFNKGTDDESKKEKSKEKSRIFDGIRFHVYKLTVIRSYEGEKK